MSQRPWSERVLLAIAVGAVAFAVPHFYALFVQQQPTFFDRSGTLWVTYVLLFIPAVLAGLRSARWPWAFLAATVTGAALAAFGFLVVTTKMHVVWLALVLVAVVLTAPVVLVGTGIGVLARVVLLPRIRR